MTALMGNRYQWFLGRRGNLLLFKRTCVEDSALNAGICLQFGNDDFQVLKCKIFTEDGEIKLVDSFLRVLAD